jgi:hypothetical protein
VSKKQAALFRLVASGKKKVGGLTPDKAKEMVSGFPTKGLPETSKGEAFKKAAAKRHHKRRGHHR